MTRRNYGNYEYPFEPDQLIPVLECTHLTLTSHKAAGLRTTTLPGNRVESNGSQLSLNLSILFYFWQWTGQDGKRILILGFTEQDCILLSKAYEEWKMFPAKDVESDSLVMQACCKSRHRY